MLHSLLSEKCYRRKWRKHSGIIQSDPKDSIVPLYYRCPLNDYSVSLKVSRFISHNPLAYIPCNQRPGSEPAVRRTTKAECHWTVVVYRIQESDVSVIIPMSRMVFGGYRNSRSEQWRLARIARACVYWNLSVYNDGFLERVAELENGLILHRSNTQKQYTEATTSCRQCSNRSNAPIQEHSMYPSMHEGTSGA